MSYFRMGLRFAFRWLLFLMLCVGQSAIPMPSAKAQAPDDASGVPELVVVTSAVRVLVGGAYKATYNAARDRLYALQGDLGTYTSAIAEINPTTGAVERTFPAIGYALAQAISENGRYLSYVALAHDLEIRTTVRRIDLDSGVVDLTYTGVVTTVTNPVGLLTNIISVPGTEESVIVVQWDGFGAYELRVYDHGIARPQTYLVSDRLSDLAFSDPTVLVGRGEILSPTRLHRIQLEADGLSPINTMQLPAEEANMPMAVAGDHVYFSNGAVLDLTTSVMTQLYTLREDGNAIFYRPDEELLHVR